MSTSIPVIDVHDLKFRWSARANTVLDISSFQLHSGERVFLKGASGSGKTTLLSLVAGIVSPQAGEVLVLGRALKDLQGAARDRFRAAHIGFIFQLFNLLPYLSLIENVVLPCRFSPDRYRRATERSGAPRSDAMRLLDKLELGNGALLSRPVTELSVGQQQRVAAARALIGAPEIVVADEPTSSLDADTKERFIELLFEECAEGEASLLFVSHDAALGPLFDRSVAMAEINQVVELN